MTTQDGILLLLFGMIVVNTGFFIGWLIVNKIINDRKKEEQREPNPTDDLFRK
jgi:uncharacterized protein YneF (UPF0154 family)